MKDMKLSNIQKNLLRDQNKKRNKWLLKIRKHKFYFRWGLRLLIKLEKMN